MVRVGGVQVNLDCADQTGRLESCGIMFAHDSGDYFCLWQEPLPESVKVSPAVGMNSHSYFLG